ncbi:hypothetical protein [Streptomyces sp. NRRL WC-3725]|uniref:hypothetical protein n=1 Tax=Streptomyces sp. NRRL WC-3725 TaxID=1463933 RepID=UPI0018FF2589|nr:hypothetical protein [Streptomyces sp. NRRL WC-3725]
MAWTDALVPELASRIGPDALVPELASRIGPDAPDADLRAHTMINTAPGCFDVALVRWLEAGADLSLAGLVDDVFGFVRIPHA